MLALPLILASCARSHVTSFLGTSNFLGTHTKLDYGYDSSGSPTSCGLSPGWDATEPPLGPTPGLVTAGLGQTPGCKRLPWHSALPASPPAWAFWVLGEDWDRPFPSGFKDRAGHWSRSGPQIYHQSVLGRFLNIGGRRWGHSEKPLPGTAEEKWLEQKHWTMAAEALKWRVGGGGGVGGLGGGGARLKRPFYTLAQGPWGQDSGVHPVLRPVSSSHRQPALCHRCGPSQLQQLPLGSSPWFSGAFNLIRDGKAVPSHWQWVSGIIFR